MSYEFHGAVAATALADRIARERLLRFVELPHALAVLLVDETWQPGPALSDFEHLTQAGAGALAALSLGGPIAYVEIDEQSDLTWQGAVGWSGGRIALPASISRPGEARRPDGGPVAAAFAFLGAAIDPSTWDFGDAGLYRFRHMNGWRSAARRPT